MLLIHDIAKCILKFVHDFLKHVSQGAEICLDTNFQMEQECVAGWQAMEKGKMMIPHLKLC